MKIIKSFLLYILLSASSLLMVSCDDDIDRAMTLSGQWRGNFGMYYEEEYRGKILHYDSYDTDIVFYPDHDYATHGWGKQVDWYDKGPYEKLYYRFKWEIEDGVIYLSYKHNHELDTAIRDYKMNSDRFVGYFDNASERFHLYKIADFYDWVCYDDDWEYHDWRRDNYNEGSRAADAQDGCLNDETHTIMKFGNRFKE